MNTPRTFWHFTLSFFMLPALRLVRHSFSVGGSICVVGIFAFSILLIPSGAYAQDITTGLTGHWKFDEGSGTTATDSSGSNNTGTLTNGPAWTIGKNYVI